MRLLQRFVLVALGMLASLAGLSAPSPSQAQQPPSWLDQQPLSNWNRPGMAIPTPAPLALGGLGPSPADWPPQCFGLLRHAETDEDRQLNAQGWFLAQPYQAGYGIKVIPAQASFDGMCRPWGYNTFVFVNGVFAGTIAPAQMHARTDGSAGTVQFLGGPGNQLVVTFQRYTPNDPLCCPSARTTVQYEVQLSPPLLIPQNTRTEQNPRN
ncbi:MAG: LppP/LprE family lipoprotein [Chloroflexi bacterium]|nr:LppP/LprE family lipoprotein [Chloroflexota bacterium]